MNVFYREIVEISYGKNALMVDERLTTSKLHYGEIKCEKESKYRAQLLDGSFVDIYEPSPNQLCESISIPGQLVQNIKCVHGATITRKAVDMKTLKVDDVKNLPLNEYIQFVKDNGFVI